MTIDGKGHKDDLVTSFNYPSGITVDRSDNIYVCDTNNKRVVLLTKDGKFIQDIQTTGINISIMSIVIIILTVEKQVSYASALQYASSVWNF